MNNKYTNVKAYGKVIAKASRDVRKATARNSKLIKALKAHSKKGMTINDLVKHILSSEETSRRGLVSIRRQLRKGRLQQADFEFSFLANQLKKSRNTYKRLALRAKRRH